MNKELTMSPNPLVAFLEKPAAEFTKADIISYISAQDIRMVNFMYPAGDEKQTVRAKDSFSNKQKAKDHHT